MAQDWPGDIRSKGFFWLATRMPYVGLWSRAGTQSDIQMAGKWFSAIPRHMWPKDPEKIAHVKSNWQEPYGDRRQEIVLIGYVAQMDAEQLTRHFESCLLTDEEMQGGEQVWAKLADPFPTWVSAG